MCDKAPGCFSRGIPLLLPEKRMSQWIQPQPESLHTNICVMRHARIKPSGCPPMVFFFVGFSFLASSHADVNAGGRGVHKLTLRPQSHTPTNATSVLPRVARVKGPLVLLGCRLFVVKLFPANLDLQVSGRGMRCPSEGRCSQRAAQWVITCVGVGTGFKDERKVCVLP